MNAQQLQAEIEIARLKLGHLEALLSLERAEIPSVQPAVSHASHKALPAPSLSSTKTCRQCGREKNARAFKGGGDTCTVCQREAKPAQRADKAILREIVANDKQGAYWRKCTRCKAKKGVRQFWGKGVVCRQCDPDGETRPDE